MENEITKMKQNPEKRRRDHFRCVLVTETPIP